jgi:transposase
MEKMSEREWRRYEAAEQVRLGVLSNAAAAELLGLSARQMRRLRRRVAQLGLEGARHGNAGRAPAHRLAGPLRTQIVELRQGKYAGFNDQHFSEELAANEQIVVSRSSVRRLLRAAGIASPQPRCAKLHRRRRLRKAQAGLMMLWDGSTHDWLERRGPRLCLMAAIDDATGEVLPGAHFIATETGAGYLRLLYEIARDKGLPWSVYMDRHSSLVRNDDHWSAQELAVGVQEPTHVGRALQALQIRMIGALSPQAKGRVERLWRTLQDRLVSQLRLKGARTLEQANAVLGHYRPCYNRRFGKPAVDPAPAWRPLHPAVDLTRICSFGYQATVLNDNTVRLSGLIIDIAPGPRQCSYARARVEVRQLLDGSWRVYRHDQLIATAPATSSKQLRAIKGRQHLGPGRPSQAANTGGSSATTTEGRVHRVHKALRSS